MSTDATYLSCRSGDGRVTDDEARAEIARLVGDPDFHCTERNRNFLRFIAEALLDGRGDSIKAYTIAVDVFGRPASFDPAIDPIVRIEATRLRASLVNYYERRGAGGGLRIELPKGRYVPTFAKVGHDEEPPLVSVGAPSNMQLDDPLSAEPTQRPLAYSRLMPTRAMIGSALGIGVFAGILLGVFLLFALPEQFGTREVSEKPLVWIEMRLTGSRSDAEAAKLADSLMVALSRFQTLRVMSQDAGVADRQVAYTAASKGRSYHVVLKYVAAASRRSVWWQVVDMATGEALRSGDESVSMDTPPDDDTASDQLVTRLAISFGGIRGIINSLEASDELEHPTLGNGCVLRAQLALQSDDPGSLANAHNCLEQTLALRPGDPDVHAMLAAVLLNLDGWDAPTALTERALVLARQSVSLAPDSARSAHAEMMAEFRTGHQDAAIASGRRALTLNPYNGAATARLGYILVLAGRWDEAVALTNASLRTDGLPRADMDLTLALDSYRRGDFEAAADRLEKSGGDRCFRTELFKAAAFGQLGRSADAQQTIAKLQEISPGFERNILPAMRRWQVAPTLLASLQEGLERAGIALR